MLLVTQFFPPLQMMIDMTKAVRRVRHVRKLEEGELEDSDGGEDEQGDLDGVAMIDGKSKGNSHQLL